MANELQGRKVAILAADGVERVEPPTFMRHDGDRCRPRPICARP